jgi:uncharacterized RDD family membrane protein YckC
MTYPQWWERLVAGIVDGIILAIVTWLITMIFTQIAIGMGSFAMLRILGILAVLIAVAITVGYKVFFEGGKWQATPGKMIFGIKLVGEGQSKPDTKSVFMRTWPWWIQLILILPYLFLTGTGLFGFLILIAMIAIFCTFFMAPAGRCIHDQTANLHVIKAGEGMVKTGGQ